MSALYVGDVGTEIVLDCVADVSAASARTIVVRKPNGHRVEWAASPEETTSIKYVTAPGDIDLAGVWRVQARVTLPDWEGYGEVGTFEVTHPL